MLDVPLSLPQMLGICYSDTGSQAGALSWKISGSRGEDLTREQGNMSITFEGQSSSGINLYAPLWNTSLRVYSSSLIHFLPRAIRARGDDCPRAVSCDSGLTLFTARSQVLFALYFWSRLLDGFLIDRDPDQWLAVAGLLSQYWIHSVSLPAACTASFLVGDWKRFINEVQLPLLCLHTPATSWPSQCPVCLLTHVLTK